MDAKRNLLQPGAVLAAAFALLVTACAGTPESTDTGDDLSVVDSTEAAVDSTEAAVDDRQAPVDEARAAVAEAEKVPAFDVEASPIDVSQLSGSKVFYVPLASSPQTQAIKAAMEEVADKVGVDLRTCETRGENEQFAQCLDQALATTQDVVILNADPAGLGPQLEALRDAGIPVLSLHLFPEGTSVDDVACKGCAAGITAVQPAPVIEPARLMVQWVLSQGGEVNAIIPMIQGLPPTPPMEESMERTFAEACPECSYKFLPISVADVLGDGYETSLSSALNADPGINYIISQSDFLLPATMAALNTTGRVDVQIVSRNGLPAALSMLIDDTPLRMTIGESNAWIGYAAMDNAFRLMLGEPAIQEAPPSRAWTRNNVADAGDPPSGNDGYGTAYVDVYPALWGLSW